jgi:hypothetical protein
MVGFSKTIVLDSMNPGVANFLDEVSGLRVNGLRLLRYANFNLFTHFERRFANFTQLFICSNFNGLQHGTLPPVCNLII